MSLKVEKISTEAFGNRGKWNQKAITAFLKDQHKPQTAIKVPLSDFYKEFYGGAKVIKYAGYYSRKHLLDAMFDLHLKGLVEVESGTLKIRFDN
jgi:hypothetical protein